VSESEIMIDDDCEREYNYNYNFYNNFKSTILTFGVHKDL